MPDLTRLDATADEFVMGRFDVGDDQSPFGRARRGRSYSLAERDGARGARGCELDNAKSWIERRLFLSFLQAAANGRVKPRLNSLVFVRRSECWQRFLSRKQDIRDPLGGLRRPRRLGNPRMTSLGGCEKS